MTVLRPGIFGDDGVLAAVSTRHGGVSGPGLGLNLSFSVGDAEANVLRNREIFFGLLGIGLEEIAVPRQVHGSRVLRVDAPGIFAECDAVVTSRVRVFLCVTIADCVPVLLFDPVTRTVAAVHAGWRGTAGGIVARALTLLGSECDVRAHNLLAYLGPAAATCCYTVGEEVASMFAPEFVLSASGTHTVDLKGANLRQLLEGGVRASNIEVSPHCTISEPDLFHSHRRDASRSGRMMAVLGLTR